MFELIYTSVSPEGLTENGLLEIQLEAQKHNTSIGVTGMLVYYDREIMQILEGDQETVETLYESICHDERHTLVEVFYSGEIKQRAFSDWSMEVVVLDEGKVKRYLYNDRELGIENPLHNIMKTNPNRGKKTFLSLRDTYY